MQQLLLQLLHLFSSMIASILSIVISQLLSYNVIGTSIYQNFIAKKLGIMRGSFNVPAMLGKGLYSIPYIKEEKSNITYKELLEWRIEMILKDTYTLANGVKVPKIGLGTWQIPDGEEAYNSVMWALKNGYRHIDTAMAYGNEESVGKAIKDAGIPREEIFVTTKLPAEKKGFDIAKECFEKSLELLGTGYIDLYLIHAPWPWSEWGKDCTEGNIECWKALEEIYAERKVRAIGVSNFEPKHLHPILEICKTVPMVDQISFHIGNRQEETVAFCKEKNIQLMAYSPLATGRIIGDDDIVKMAEKYGKTPAQICVRYCIQKNAIVIPKSTKKERIISNAEVDFVITEEDMKVLDQK